MTDDTSRRERALATVDEIPPDADMDWADAQETRSDYGLGFLVGYLAGSREEAEIRSEEVERLESVARGLKQCCEEYRAEIAALREAVRVYYSPTYDAAKIMAIRDSPAVRRALEAAK